MSNKRFFFELCLFVVCTSFVLAQGDLKFKLGKNGLTRYQTYTTPQVEQLQNVVSPYQIINTESKQNSEISQKVAQDIANVMNTMMTPAEMIQFQVSIFQLQNKLRTNVGLPPLQWSPELSAFALNHIMTTEANSGTCALSHSSAALRQAVGPFTNIGENLYISTVNMPTAEDAVSAWYNQGLCYRYNAFGDQCTMTIPISPQQKCSPAATMAKYFTQIMWSTTTHVGCAIHKCSTCTTSDCPKYVVACNYGSTMVSYGGNISGKVPFDQSIAERLNIPVCVNNNVKEFSADKQFVQFNEIMQTPMLAQTVVDPITGYPVMIRIAQQVLTQVPQQVLTQVPQQVLTQVPQQVLTQVPQQLVDQVSQQLLAQVQQQLATQVPQQLATQVSQQLATQVSQQLATQVQQQLATQVPQQLATQVPQQLATQVQQQLATQIPQQLATQIPQQLATQVPQQLATQIPQQLAKQIPQQLATQVPQQFVDQVSQQLLAQVQKQLVTEVPQQLVDQVSQQIIQNSKMINPIVSTSNALNTYAGVVVDPLTGVPTMMIINSSTDIPTTTIQQPLTSFSYIPMLTDIPINTNFQSPNSPMTVSAQMATNMPMISEPMTSSALYSIYDPVSSSYIMPTMSQTVYDTARESAITNLLNNGKIMYDPITDQKQNQEVIPIGVSTKTLNTEEIPASQIYMQKAATIPLMTSLPNVNSPINTSMPAIIDPEITTKNIRIMKNYVNGSPIVLQELPTANSFAGQTAATPVKMTENIYNPINAFTTRFPAMASTPTTISNTATPFNTKIRMMIMTNRLNQNTSNLAMNKAKVTDPNTIHSAIPIMTKNPITNMQQLIYV